MPLDPRTPRDQIKTSHAIKSLLIAWGECMMAENLEPAFVLDSLRSPINGPFPTALTQEESI